MSSETSTTIPSADPSITAAVDAALIDLLTLSVDNPNAAATRARAELSRILTRLDESVPTVDEVAPILRTAHEQLHSDDVQGARASLVAARARLSRPISHRYREDSAIGP